MNAETTKATKTTKASKASKTSKTSKTTTATTEAMNTDGIFIVKRHKGSYVQRPYCSEYTHEMFKDFRNIQLPNHLSVMSPIEQLSNFGELFLTSLYRHILELQAATMSDVLLYSEKEKVQNLIGRQKEIFAMDTSLFSHFQTLCEVFREVRNTSQVFYTEVCLCPWEDLYDLTISTFGECRGILREYMECYSSIYGEHARDNLRCEFEKD